MSVQEPVAQVLPSQPITERAGWSAAGVPVLVAGVVAALVAIALLATGIALKSGGGTALIVVAALVFIAAGLAFRGLTPVVTSRAARPAGRGISHV